MEMDAREEQQLSASTQVHKIFTQSTKKAVSGQPCYRCGFAPECWCKDVDCRNCGKKGHIERACRNKKFQTNKQYKERKKKKHVNKIAHEQDEDKAKLRMFAAGDTVLARNYTNGIKWKPAIIVA